MLLALQVISPLIFIIFLGYLIFRFKILDNLSLTTLNKFVFLIAAPALLFRNTAITEFPDIFPWSLWSSYFLGMTITAGLGMLVGLNKTLNNKSSSAVIKGFGSSFSNTVMLGIPVVLTAFGEEAGIPLFLILALHGLISFSLASLFLEITTKNNNAPKETALAVMKSISGLPVVIALASGLLWNITNLPLPGFADKFLELLGGVAIPLALFGIGGSLTQVKLSGSISSAVLISALKLLIHPVLVFILANYVFKLPGLWVATATVLASMPTGIFVSVFADRYEVEEDLSSSVIMISTLAGGISISIWLAFFNDYLI